MSDHTELNALTGMVGERVVLDTATSVVFLGTLEAVTADSYVLSEADIHDCNEGKSGKELYVLETAQLGIRPSRRRLYVMRAAVISVSRLSDVVLD